MACALLLVHTTIHNGELTHKADGRALSSPLPSCPSHALIPRNWIAPRDHRSLTLQRTTLTLHLLPLASLGLLVLQVPLPLLLAQTIATPSSPPPRPTTLRWPTRAATSVAT